MRILRMGSIGPAVTLLQLALCFWLFGRGGGV